VATTTLWIGQRIMLPSPPSAFSQAISLPVPKKPTHIWGIVGYPVQGRPLGKFITDHFAILITGVCLVVGINLQVHT
jgi:hypothetical protein